MRTLFSLGNLLTKGHPQNCVFDHACRQVPLAMPFVHIYFAYRITQLEIKMNNHKATYKNIIESSLEQEKTADHEISTGDLLRWMAP